MPKFRVTLDLEDIIYAGGMSDFNDLIDEKLHEDDKLGDREFLEDISYEAVGAKDGQVIVQVVASIAKERY